MDLELTTQRLGPLSEGVDVWESMFQIVVNMLSWIPRLCQGIDTMFSGGGGAGAGAADSSMNRSNLTYFIISKQLSFIERVLVYAIYYDHPQHVSMILTVFCSSVASSLRGQVDAPELAATGRHFYAQ